jgi:hypothetical protein
MMPLCYRNSVRFPLKHICALLLLSWAATSIVWAQRFELLDGQVLNGPPVAITKDGVNFRDPANDGTIKVPWTNLTQNALKELEKNPRAKKLVEPYLEIPLDAKDGAKPVIEVRDFERLQPPNPAWGLGKMFSSGLGWFFVVLLFSANLYAAYEIGIFRNYPPLLVCGLAAVLPVVIPAIFICLPTRIPPADEPAPEVVAAAEAPLIMPSQQRAAAAAAAAAAQGAPDPSQQVATSENPSFKRGEFTFNKRFFETKMQGFFGINPSDTAKGLIFEVKTSNAIYLCNRIVNALPNELRLQVVNQQTIEEVGVPYNDVLEVQIKAAS